MNLRTPRVWNGIIHYELAGIAPIRLTNPIQILRDSYHSFFIHSSLGLKFTIGTSEGMAYAQNEDLVLFEGGATYAEFGEEFW